MVRRAEYALGKAIRKGQAEGSISGGVAERDRRDDGRLSVGTASRPIDFGTRSEIYGVEGKHGSTPGVLDLADETPEPEAFDAALAEAKAEGNLSRANVARKAREARAGCTASVVVPPLTNNA